MNKIQKAALQVVADMIASEMLEIAVSDVQDHDTKQDVCDSLQSYTDDGAYELIDSLANKVETEMMKSYKKKARQYVANMGKKK